jgi:NADH-quinone oxidoreductase subunit E
MLPPARVFGVATFYAHFALEPKGKHVIRICDGTACHVKQSLPMLSAIHEKLGTSEKSKTTPDMRCSPWRRWPAWEPADWRPCGDRRAGLWRMSPERAVALVDEIKAQENAGDSQAVRGQ